MGRKWWFRLVLYVMIISLALSTLLFSMSWLTLS